MAGIGFSDAVTTQLSLAELHGNLALSLEKISAYLENMRKVKKKLIEVSTYPLILLGFLVLIMLGLRNYLLPQMDAQNIGTQLISSFPQLFLALGAGLVPSSYSAFSIIESQARSRFLEPCLICLSEKA